MRLDRFLQSFGPDRSRAFWQRQIEAGRVLVNGRREKAGYVLKPGQTVQVEPVKEMPPALKAAQGSDAGLPDWVVYLDEHLMVVNKPRGLVVHPSAGHWQDSLVHRLLPWLPHEEGEWRPGVVHRLDRDTSGLMVLARHQKAREALSVAIQARQVTRQYVAVARGRLAPEKGVIDAPLGRDPRQRLRMAVVYGGREARTHYRTVARWPGMSLLALTLETGRTHQIRVHLASLGHPVVGDPLYGGRLEPFRHGQLLHAGRLAFEHPVSKKRLAFTALPPSDWAQLAQFGAPEIAAPYVYAEGVEPTTPQWLSALSIPTL
ncbi:RluA family pseudouridine synthase [Sulfobacillus sp. DSM 109850]|uniref:Pseudouridine synthase n=2 Tax=Sulfobacillus harzensis TaxID=2729629 RepID=A0A7Y0L257_9FIRM|nr:RluA family pseudouridine synthase [Sulfobacillus harzensis]NMP21637.1 RluA family pseudouridine synthase [Sulfobacillus harzensis]